MKIIALGGSPGTGKTTIAKALQMELDCVLLSIGDHVKEKRIYDSWDNELNTYIVDETKLHDSLIEEISRLKHQHPETGCLIVEGILSDVIGDITDVAFILRLHPSMLQQRLSVRGYTPEKISENVQSELLGTCTKHMLDARGKDFIDIDLTGMTVPEATRLIADLIKGKISKEKYLPGLVDWINDPDIDPVSFF